MLHFLFCSTVAAARTVEGSMWLPWQLLTWIKLLDLLWSWTPCPKLASTTMTVSFEAQSAMDEVLSFVHLQCGEIAYIVFDRTNDKISARKMSLQRIVFRRDSSPLQTRKYLSTGLLIVSRSRTSVSDREWCVRCSVASYTTVQNVLWTMTVAAHNSCSTSSSTSYRVGNREFSTLYLTSSVFPCCTAVAMEPSASYGAGPGSTSCALTRS